MKNEEVCKGIGDDEEWTSFESWVLLDSEDGLFWEFICSEPKCNLCNSIAKGEYRMKVVARIELVEGLRK